MDRLRQRLARDEGFTLTALLFALSLTTLFRSIAVPSYLGFKDRANRAAAAADVRSALPSAEAVYSDCNTYNSAAATACSDRVSRTFNVAGLTGYDSGIKIGQVIGNAASYWLSMKIGRAHV